MFFLQLKRQMADDETENVINNYSLQNMERNHQENIEELDINS